MRISPFAALLIAFSLCTGSALAQRVSIHDVNPRDSAIIERWSQVFDAVWPLQTANAELCETQAAYLPGFMAMGVDDGTGVRILQVASQSPAELAGLREGDFITSINGEPTNHRKASRAGEQFNAAYDEAITRSEPMVVEITRDGSPMAVEIASVPACDFRMLYTGQLIPTLVQDNIVLVGTGLDQYAANPEQMRMYLSRDFAHVLLKHREQRGKTANRYNRLSDAASFLTGGRTPAVHGAAIANWKHAPQQDIAADRLGLYLVARTGDDITDAPTYWEAIFAQHRGNAVVSRLLNTGRGSPERLEAIKETTAELLLKQSEGEALIPPEES